MLYELVGVVVHDGDAEGGHYYSLILDRTEGGTAWYRFDDLAVTSFDVSSIKDYFGGEHEVSVWDPTQEKHVQSVCEKQHAAYILFYERTTIARAG